MPLFSRFRSKFRQRTPVNGRRPFKSGRRALGWIKDTASRVNTVARKQRHQKLFNISSQRSSASTSFFLYLNYVKRFLERLFAESKAASERLFSGYHGQLLSPRQHLKRICVFILVFFLIGSVNMGYAHDGLPDGMDSQYYADEDIGSDLVTDEEGYLVKAVPSELNDGVYIKRNDLIAEHQIQPGQTLSGIADMYGIKTRTIMWANDIANPNRLTEGDKLLIPRADGILYRIKTGDTVDKIAKRYDIKSEKIRQENKLDGDLLALNQIILLPAAVPLSPEQDTGRLIASSKSVSAKAKNKISTTSLVPKPADKVSTGTNFLFPTIGIITQKFHSGHYAIDIANRAPNIPVYAAADGVVIRADGGNEWHGGYGNVTVIQHADGIQTLYGHQKVLYVTKGQKVKRGEVIGLMGSTGRSTGPHVHFEVVDNGVKRNPLSYVSP